MIWLRPLGYELDVDQASATITAPLIEEIDNAAKHFGTYDVFKSKVVTNLKIATIVKKKDKLIKKIKKRFGVEVVGTEEEEEVGEEDYDSENEEDEPRQGPLQLTQGLGEDKEEGVEEEEAEEAPTKTKGTKRKAKAQPTPQPKAKKVEKSAAKKPTTRATTLKVKKEVEKKKKSTKKTDEEPRRRRKYVAQLDSDEEKIESGENR